MSFLLYIILVPFIIYLLAKLVMMLPQFGQQPFGEHLKKISSSPNYIKGRFRTKVRLATEMSLSKVPTLIKQNNERKVNKRPKIDIPVIKTLKEKRSELTNGCRVTWLGHSSIFLEMEGQKILIDPQLGSAASPLPFTVKRFNKTIPITVDELPEIDLVLLSHDHYDHLDYFTIKNIKHKVKRWITPLGVSSHLRKWGIDQSLISEHDWWEDVTYNNIKFSSTPNKHFSGRKTNDRNKTLWCSWVITSKNYNIYFSSDSGYWSGFKQIGEKFGPFDLCMVECGQYNHLWRENHMFPEESLQAFLDLKGQLMLPIHWGAFSLAPHDWREPIERLLKSAQERNVTQITTPWVGESIVIGDSYPQRKWWQ